MTPFLNKDQQDKILTPKVRRLLAALPPESTRVVGGAVRDVLLEREIGDIDLATKLPPDQIVESLTKAHIKTVPTGIAYGTITAIIDRVGFEITTLRRDVETDGRHAQVAYTDDWKEDAARRDFTINALYVDAQGSVTDCFDGIADITAGRIKFIGKARERIREDVLRILRFFRFYAFFGKEPADKEALDACRDLAGLIPALSSERISREFLKLLKAADPLPALILMRKSGVLERFLPEATEWTRLQTLLTQEKAQAESPDAIVRFAALLPENKKETVLLAKRLKLPNRDRDKLGVLAELPKILMNARDSAIEMHRIFYRFGGNDCRAAAFLTGAACPLILKELTPWTCPILPIKGQDIVKMGIAPGPEVGRILREVEAWWMAGNFTASRAACLDLARRSI